jgi:hypothetical protein
LTRRIEFEDLTADEMIQTKARVVASFDARLFQYKTMLQSRIDREQIRQSFQLFLGRFLVPTNCTTPPNRQPNGATLRLWPLIHLCLPFPLRSPTIRANQRFWGLAWGDYADGLVEERRVRLDAGRGARGFGVVAAWHGLHP